VLQMTFLKGALKGLMLQICQVYRLSMIIHCLL